MTPTPTTSSGFLSLSDPVTQFLLKIAQGLAILAITFLIARVIKLWVVRILTRTKVTLSMATLLGNVAQVAVGAIGIVTALTTFGVDLPALLTVLGAAGLAVSLSMQDILRNVVAGVYILVESPFRIGDRITVKDVTGVVQGIELRTTILKTEDNLQIVVPNNIVLTEIVTNRSVSDLQRQILQVRTPMGSLADLSAEVNEALKAIPEIAPTPSPVIALERVIDGTARLRLEFWVPGPQRVAATAQTVEAIQRRLPEANITVL
jgi:small-conductance mechanosensitive channel